MRTNWLLFAFGLYYLVTGLWPIIDVDTFMVVTGPKAEVWLVKTVGATLSVVGLAYCLQSKDSRWNYSILPLVLLIPIVLTLIDIYYSYSRVISYVYLFDAIIQLSFLLLFLTIYLPAIRKQLKETRK